MGKYKTNSERIAVLEHTIDGNGSIGMREQLDELRKEVRELKKIIRFATAIILMFFGEKIYEYIKYFIHAL